MAINKIKKLGISVAVVAIVIVGAWQLPKIMTSAEQLSETDARNKVNDLYNGEILEVIEQNNTYKLMLKTDTGLYEIEIDRKTGDVGAINTIKQEQAKPSQEQPKQEQTQPKSSESPAIQQVKQLTEQQAAAIALKNVSGEIDDIKIETLNGVAHYLVEVERENGAEGIVQINAITGKVKSITWDD